MHFTSYPAQQDDGTFRSLKDCLAVITEHAWTWTVLEFNGIGIPPDNLSMNRFEQVIRERPHGFLMPWRELQNFAENIQQTYDCLIIATNDVDSISEDRSRKENFQNCEVVIEALDSTEWFIGVRDDNP